MQIWSIWKGYRRQKTAEWWSVISVSETGLLWVRLGWVREAVQSYDIFDVIVAVVKTTESCLMFLLRVAENWFKKMSAGPIIWRRLFMESGACVLRTQLLRANMWIAMIRLTVISISRGRMVWSPRLGFQTNMKVMHTCSGFTTSQNHRSVYTKLNGAAVIFCQKSIRYVCDNVFYLFFSRSCHSMN